MWLYSCFELCNVRFLYTLLHWHIKIEQAITTSASEGRRIACILYKTACFMKSEVCSETNNGSRLWWNVCAVLVKVRYTRCVYGNSLHALSEKIFYEWWQTWFSKIIYKYSSLPWLLFRRQPWKNHFQTWRETSLQPQLYVFFHFVQQVKLF